MAARPQKLVASRSRFATVQYTFQLFRRARVNSGSLFDMGTYFLIARVLGGPTILLPVRADAASAWGTTGGGLAITGGDFHGAAPLGEGLARFSCRRYAHGRGPAYREYACV